MEEERQEHESDDPDMVDFVEVDPTGRYGRYAEVLGRGNYKTVYKAFDTLEGIEVAWNQMRVRVISHNSSNLDPSSFQSGSAPGPEAQEYNQVIKLYCSWVNHNHSIINFITEIFTSGNLCQYRQKHKNVELRALKLGEADLLYSHNHDPPVIHRDLKCDDIFVNGNHGEIKIGDLGLAAMLCDAQTVCKVIDGALSLVIGQLVCTTFFCLHRGLNQNLSKS